MGKSQNLFSIAFLQQNVIKLNMLFNLTRFTGLPDNFTIHQKAELFFKTKLKRLPYKYNLSFCLMAIIWQASDSSLSKELNDSAKWSTYLRWCSYFKSQTFTIALADAILFMLAMWPDLEKFHHFGKFIIVFSHFWMV